ncbi:hypothetical protein ACS0TY_008806 [Phlomoides rotata]
MAGVKSCWWFNHTWECLLKGREFGNPELHHRCVWKISTTLGTKMSKSHPCLQMLHIWSTRLDMNHHTRFPRNLITSRLDIKCGLRVMAQ